MLFHTQLTSHQTDNEGMKTNAMLTKIKEVLQDNLISNEFKQKLLPLLDQIESLKTSEADREILIREAHECCLRQLQTSATLKNLGEDLTQLSQSLYKTMALIHQTHENASSLSRFFQMVRIGITTENTTLH